MIKIFKLILLFVTTFVVVSFICMVILFLCLENSTPNRTLYIANASDEILNIKVSFNSELTYDLKINPSSHKEIQWSFTNQKYYKFEMKTKDRSEEFNYDYDEGIGPYIYCILFTSNGEFVVKTIGGSI